MFVKETYLKADIIQFGIPNGVTAVVNVTGAPIMTPFKYFGTGFKKQIRTSRVGSTVLLADIIRRAKSKPEVLIAVTSTGKTNDANPMIKY